jgi:hypothetical protein
VSAVRNADVFNQLDDSFSILSDSNGDCFLDVSMLERLENNLTDSWQQGNTSSSNSPVGESFSGMALQSTPHQSIPVNEERSELQIAPSLTTSQILCYPTVLSSHHQNISCQPQCSEMPHQELQPRMPCAAVMSGRTTLSTNTSRQLFNPLETSCRPVASGVRCRFPINRLPTNSGGWFHHLLMFFLLA